MKMAVKGLGIAVLAVLLVFALTGCNETEGTSETSTTSNGSTPVVTPSGSKVITIATIQGVIVPAYGLTPVTAITETEQYSGTVTWNGNPSTFTFLTVYTATITLTPKAGYTLQGIAADFFKVAGGTSVNNTASSGVVTAVFPKTDSRLVNKIEIKTQPDKLTYMSFETLDLTGLVVTLTYDNNDKTDVVAANFSIKSITVTPAQGDKLNYSYNEKPIKIAYGNLTRNTNNLTIINNSKIEMVSIPAGTFIMGSPTSEPNRYSDETQHSVTLSAFSMSKYQVTQAQYQEVMGVGEDRTTTSYGKGDNNPIYYVSWYDAIVFCNKLSIKEGLDPVYSINGSTDPADWGAIPTNYYNATWDVAVMNKSKNGYRLPTEAEWEYACRGDYPNKATETNTKPFGIGDGTKMVSGMANFYVTNPYDLAKGGHYEDSSATGYVGKTTEVGSYAANNYGLYDMHGNVWEWCWDWYGSYSSGSQTDPTGAVAGSYRVVRGGYWLIDGQFLRSAYRISSYPYYRSSDIGFRLVRF
jgi:formylglycine-generating enzyme required for sulfatase activity